MLEIKDLKTNSERTLVSREAAVIFGGDVGDNTVCGGATIDYEGDGGQTQHAYNDHFQDTSYWLIFSDREVIVDSGGCPSS